MSAAHYRPLSRRIALVVLFSAPVFSGACSKEPEKKPEHRDYGSGIASMSMVQRNLEATRRPAPAPAPVEVEKPAPKVTAPAPAPVAAPTEPRPRPRKPAAAAATHAVPAPVIEPAPVTTDVVAALTESPEPTIVPPPAPAAVAPAVVVPLPDDESSPIYSKDNPEVIPARLVTELSGSGTSTLLSDVNQMELVISKMGRVQQVKLSAPPKRMTDMLLLSGAKTWKFTPALKDGQPVRYRTVVSWETTR